MSLQIFRQEEHEDVSASISLLSASLEGKKVYIKTYGCSHNQSDSEQMAGILQQQGCTFTDIPEDADVCIINSCTVKGPSESSFLSLVKKLEKKKIIVAGCVPQADPKHFALQKVSIVGVQQIDRIAQAVESTLQGVRAVHLERNHRINLNIPKVRRNRFIEIIPINDGCLGACTYCKTKHARGHLKSRDVNEIKEAMLNAVHEGVTEFWITSEDCGAYGRDIGLTLPNMMKELLLVSPPYVMFRIGMTNPPYVLQSLDEISDILKHPQVYSFIHIPVQAASNKVLDAMKRDYTIEEFQHIVDVLRENVPGITIATDIICGFPNETAEDFQQTMELVERNKFPVLNISQFYARPDTPAARMQQLPREEVKQRSTMLTQLFKEQKPYDSLLGATLEVWVSEYNERDQLLGHTKSYVPVILEVPEDYRGKKAFVKITKIGKHFVAGELFSS